MKTIQLLITFLTVSIFGFLPTTVSGQNKDTDKSLLYKIEGNGIQTSYLFGTIHLIEKDKFVMHDKTKTAFENSDQLVLELDMDDASLQMEMLKHSIMEEGKSLKDYMSEEEDAKIDEALKEASGFSLKLFYKMKPFVLNTLFITAYVEGETTSYEETFMAMAKEKDIEILGLETVAEQIAVFDDIPYEDQIDELVQMIDEQEKNKKIFQDMVQLYLLEDVEAIFQFTREQSKESKAYDETSLLTKRNSNWIPQIGELAKDKATFFAVGAAHLGGDIGVIKLLREAGYTVTPVIQ